MKARVHISIEVLNLQRSVDFYSKVFSSEPIRLKDDYANFRLEHPQLHLALNQRAGAGLKTQGKSDQHFGIELFSEQELSSWFDKVQSAGLQAKTEENTTCCYAVADKFWLSDPDGNKWEFWHRKYDVEHTSDERKSEGCCPETSCCK
jgi:catechol 2,3-dioxygenase-like lactoylglutathione lyase family enzyme